MKYLIIFVLGVLVGIGIHWYWVQPRHGKIGSISENIRETSREAGQSLKDTFDTGKIRDELARTGRVIREKARKAGEAVTDAASNARITASIKAKLIKESTLSAFKISVDTTDGVVTLSGTVSSPEEVAKAMKIALETEGVHKVISTIQVKPD